MKSPCRILLALVVAALPACVTPTQLEVIEREQRTLRGQTSTSRGDLDSIRSSLADTRANLDQMHREINALGEKVEEVRFQLDRQIGRSTKEGEQRVKEGEQRIKDLEVKLGKVGEEIKAQGNLLKTRDDELRKLRDAMQAMNAEVASSRAAAEAREKVTVDSEAAKRDYDEAWRLVERKEYRAAIPRLKEFLKKYSNSDLGDNAQYWIGECHYALKEFDQAILEFDAVRRKYPKGDKVPAALLKQGFAFAELGDKVDARLILQELVDRYPQSDEAGKAKQKLKTLGS